jgi:hypothetical protein
MREIEAEREAKRIRMMSEAEAQAEAERIRRIVRVLREEGIQVSPEIINAILLQELLETDALLPSPADSKPLSDASKGREKKPGHANKP